MNSYSKEHAIIGEPFDTLIPYVVLY